MGSYDSGRSSNNEWESYFEHCVEQIYQGGVSYHGDLQVGMDEFKRFLRDKVDKLYLNSATNVSGTYLINSLHGIDLYLAFACTQHRQLAWERFTNIYRRYIYDMISFISSVKSFSYELTETIMTDLFLPDRSGHSRIASYDGRSSLATWLRVIINNRIINEREQKFHNAIPLDEILKKTDHEALLRIELNVRSSQYGSLIIDSFGQACIELTDRERLMLLLRYDNDLRLGQIADLLGIHQSTISRQLKGIQSKIYQKVISTLINKYDLSQVAINECIAEIIENPAYSLIVLIKKH